MVKQIISIKEITRDEILQIVETALDIKKRGGSFEKRLKDKTLLLLFQKTSTRTRLAFELGMKKLGGQTVVMDWEKSNFTISPLRYESRYIGSMVDAIMARLLRNEDIIAMADSVNIPPDTDYRSRKHCLSNPGRCGWFSVLPGFFLQTSESSAQIPENPGHFQAREASHRPVDRHMRESSPARCQAEVPADTISHGLKSSRIAVAVGCDPACQTGASQDSVYVRSFLHPLRR